DLALLLVAGDGPVDHDPHPRDRLPDAADLPRAGEVRGRDRARLREPVALVHLDAERVDEVRDVGIEGGAAADRVLETAAEAGADGRAAEAVPERERDAIDEADRLAAPLARRGRDAAAEEALDDAGTLRYLLVHAVVDPVEDARHREEDRRLHLAGVREQVRD